METAPDPGKAILDEIADLEVQRARIEAKIATKMLDFTDLHRPHPLRRLTGRTQAGYHQECFFGGRSDRSAHRRYNVLPFDAITTTPTSTHQERRFPIANRDTPRTTNATPTTNHTMIARVDCLARPGVGCMVIS